MYTPLSCGKSKFNRDAIENVSEEIKNVFAAPSLNDLMSNTEGLRGIHRHQLSNQSSVLFNIARKLWWQAENVFDSEGTSGRMSEIHEYVTGLLKMTRTTLKYDSPANAEIIKGLDVFKRSIAHFTGNVIGERVLKLVAVKQVENPIFQYFHLYLDTLWLLLTTDPIADVKVPITHLAFVSSVRYQQNKDFAICRCVKVVWLRLQLFCERKGVDFWGEFNEALECFDAGFLVAFVPFIAKLQCYDDEGNYVGVCGRVTENQDFLNARWSTVVKECGSEQGLFVQLRSIEELMCELWVGGTKLDLLYTTWDYLYKRIEGIKLNLDLSASVEKVNGDGELGVGFLLFLRILFKHLGRHPGHWNKFRGRIYVRFSPARFAKLNDEGVNNLVLLLVVISNVSFDEITQKILEFLQALPSKRRNSVVIWKVYLVLIELNLRREQSIEPVASKLMPLVQEISLDRSQFHLLSLLASHMDRLTSITSNFNLSQVGLFGPWIGSYMQFCSHADLLNFLNMLILIVERLVDSDAWYEYEGAFNANVLSNLKRLSSVNGIELMGTLAGLIATNSYESQQQSMVHFSSEAIPTNVMQAFFCTLSKHVALPAEYERIIVKSWFQCAIIGELNPDFTKFMLTLSFVKCLNLPNNATLTQFIEGLQSSGDKDCVKACFEGLERWLLKQLAACTETVAQVIYTHMAYVFSVCGRTLYSSTNAISPLTKFIDTLLLPTDVLRGFRPTNGIVKAVETTWHLYVTAIYVISADNPYLERVVRDVITRYLPFFDCKPSPLRKLMCNPELASFALTKINAEFLLQGSPRNEHTVKVLSAVNSVLEDLERMENRQLIAAQILPALFEVFMFKNQRVAIDTLKLLVQHSSGEPPEVFKRALVDLARKHLPFNTSLYFQLMNVLTKVMPRDVKAALGDIKEEIRVVEAKRGQGYDNSLRSGYDKVQKLLD